MGAEHTAPGAPASPLSASGSGGPRGPGTWDSPAPNSGQAPNPHPKACAPPWITDVKRESTPPTPSHKPEPGPELSSRGVRLISGWGGWPRSHPCYPQQLLGPASRGPGSWPRQKPWAGQGVCTSLGATPPSEPSPSGGPVPSFLLLAGGRGPRRTGRVRTFSLKMKAKMAAESSAKKMIDLGLLSLQHCEN